MSAAVSQVFLSLREQEEIISRFNIVTNRTPLKEKFFMSNGEKISYFSVLANSLVAWRTGFLGFNLHRFARGRLVTLILSAFIPCNGALLHAIFCQYPLVKFYRSENKWKYGINSLLTHQVGASVAIASNLCIGFVFAQKSGIIPMHKEVLKDGFRQPAFRYFVKKVRPHCGVMAMTFAMTSALMFVVGMREYEDSCKVLASMNRKSLCWKEEG